MIMLLRQNFKVLVILFLASSNLFSQALSIKGIVQDSLGNSIENTSVILKSDSLSIVGYTYTKKSGEYLLEIQRQGNHLL